jgi:hypothetical protein
VSKTKYVDYADHGFWAYDVALSIFLKYLVDAAVATYEAETGWLSTSITNWRGVASIPDIGLTLDADWSAAQRQTFIDLAEDACASLAKRESILAEEIVAWPLLDDLRIYPRGATEVFTGPVVELGRAVIALVSKTLPEAPQGRAWLYGTDTGRQTLGTRS